MIERTLPLAGQKRYVLLAVALAAAVVSFVFVTQSARTEIPDHGDWWTDMDHVIVGRNLALYGFSAAGYGALVDNRMEVGLKRDYYSHWPYFPALMLGALYQLGLSTTEARIFPLLISSSALIALYLVAQRIAGDWRFGLIAAMALAVSLPFRLLSDNFGYLSYDFAAVTWTILFITLGSLAVGRRRMAWFAAAGVGAFATMSLVGFEMVPAIGAYSVLFPWLFAASLANPSEQRRVALTSVLIVGVGFAAGMVFRVSHNALLLGGLEPAILDMVDAFGKRSTRPFALDRDWGYLPYITYDPLLYYLTKLVNRVLAYFPFHLLVIAVGFSLGGLLGEVTRSTADRRVQKWLGVIFFSEVLWFVIFRQHTNEHVHTIYHLSLTMSIAAAVAVSILWRNVGSSSVGRIAVALTGVVLVAVSLLNFGVRPYGNLAMGMNWTDQRKEIERISAVLPANAIVVVSTGDFGPAPEFFLERTFIRLPWVDEIDDPRGRPWFLLTQPGSDSYNGARLIGRMLTQTEQLAVFDMNSIPSPARPRP